MSPTALEGRLAREAQGGDQRALARIFGEYNQPLYRYCLAIVGDRQDAEDALQETMIKVLHSLPGEKREIALRPWLYRIAHNESVELLRRRRQSVSLEHSELPQGGGLAETVEVRERLRKLISDLNVLPERQRGALLMRETAGLDFDEIGAALETTPAVARQTIYEARLGLREMEAGREMECAAVAKTLSDGDRRVRRRRGVSAHLRDCSDCRAFAAEIDSRKTDLAAITPLPAAAAAAVLHGVFAGSAGAGAAASGGVGVATGAGASGAAGIGSVAAGTAAKSIGTATLLKAAAAVAIVAVVGIGAADRGGLIGSGNEGKSPASRSSQPNLPNEEAPGAAGTGVSHPHGSERGHISERQPDAIRAKPQRSLGRGGAASRLSSGRSVAADADPAAPRPEGGAPVEEVPVEEMPVEGAAAAAPGNSGDVHPSGRGHEKQRPPSADHGQTTAAENHAAHEAAEAPSGMETSEHPQHPAKAAKPKGPAAEAESPPAAESPPVESPPAVAAEHGANPHGQEK